MKKLTAEPAMAECLKALELVHARQRQGKLALRIPRLLGKMRAMPGAHFHLWPEIFLQLGGVTDFTFPEERFRLYPGEVCVIPRGMTHGETARAYQGPFLNLVLMYDRERVSFHFAHAKPGMRPGGDGRFGERRQSVARIAGQIDEMVELFHQGTPRSKSAALDVLSAHISCLLDIFEGESRSEALEHPRITQCKHLVASNIADPALTVAGLARWLQCAPDYLSHFFRQETGEALKACIARKRIEFAKELLRETTLSIKEAGWACGFRNANYFIRVFKKLTGQTPMHFRRALPQAAR